METSRKVNYIVGATVFVLTLVVYLITVADTVSWWDCGEFISSSYILGVPHPPGAPLYLLVGRLFSILPIGDDIAFRVNIISPITSALAILLLYLITVRLIKLWRDGNRRRFGEPNGGALPRTYSPSELLCIHVGAAVAALSAAFADTFWFNAVEAEVYGPSILFAMLGMWLTIVWMEKHQEPGIDRILFFIPYLYGLGAGVHLLCLLTVPSIFLIVVFTNVRPLKDWKLWVGVPLLFMLGYSTYYMIMIRSGLNPAIDENNPETWRSFMQFLQRKQYGSQHGLFHIFDRQAPFWTYQMGDLFIKYFLQQFPMVLPKVTAVFREAVSHNKMSVFVPVIPLALGLGGMIIHVRRDWKRFLAFFALFTAMGVGLVIYLNIGDPQPRERDYFFVGAPTIFAIWMGMSVSAVLAYVHRLFVKSGVRTPAMVFVLSLCFLVVPLSFLMNGFHSHDRSDDYIAYDYAYNILQTCEQDAILFTNGDNDTFPVWFLQEVEGIRKDVRVVNLSLLNTGWYIKQLRDFEPRVADPSSYYEDDYIDNSLTATTRDALMKRYWPKPKEVSAVGLTWTLPPTKGYNILRIQDVMVYKIVEWNNWKKPIYFAVTVSPNNDIGLEPHLSMEGMALRLVKTKGNNQLNPERMHHNLRNVYRYRGLLDDKVYKDANTRKLLANYRAAFWRLFYAYQTQGKNEEAYEVMRYAEAHIPTGLESLYWGAEISHRIGKHQEGIDYALRCLEQAGYGDPQLALSLADMVRDMGGLDQSIEIYRNTIPSGRAGVVEQAYYGLATALEQKGAYGEAVHALEQMQKARPEDGQLARRIRALQAKQKLQEAQQQETKKDSAEATQNPR